MKFKAVAGENVDIFKTKWPVNLILYYDYTKWQKFTYLFVHSSFSKIFLCFIKERKGGGMERKQVMVICWIKSAFNVLFNLCSNGYWVSRFAAIFVLLFKTQQITMFLETAGSGWGSTSIACRGQSPSFVKN